jgi:peptidoglycan/LPS O-acetylase OafA/YrhL
VFGSSGVDLFFVISGFVMVLTTRNNANVALFLYRRVSRVYPLYWCFSAILALGYFTFPELIRRANLASIGYLESFLLLPQEHFPLLVVGWTLIHEMYFYLVFAVFLLFPRNALPRLLLVWVLAILLCPILGSRESASPYYLLLSSPLTLEFIYGCYLAFYLERLPGGIGAKTFLVAIAVLLGSSIAYWQTYAEDPAAWMRVVCFGLPYTLLLYACVQRERQEDSETKNFAFLELLGDASYSIYLSHFLVLSLLSRLYARGISLLGVRYADTVIDNVIFVVLSLLTCVAFGLLSYHYVEKPLIKLTRNLWASS